MIYVNPCDFDCGTKPKGLQLGRQPFSTLSPLIFREMPDRTSSFVSDSLARTARFWFTEFNNWSGEKNEFSTSHEWINKLWLIKVFFGYGINPGQPFHYSTTPAINAETLKD